MKLFLKITLLCMLTSGLQAIEGAPYLKTSEGVRSTGMGGAFSMIAGSPESLWYNPAGLSQLKGIQGSFVHQSWENGIDSNHVLLAAPLGWRHSLGMLYHSKGLLDTYRDAQGLDGGKFEVSNSVLGLGYAFDSGTFAVGAAVKTLNEVIEDSKGSGMVMDFGIRADFYDGLILFGASYQNAGSVPVIGDPGVEIEAPTLLRVGLGLSNNSPGNHFTVSSELKSSLHSQRTTLAFGAEYMENYDDISLALRAGYDLGLADLGGLSGLTVGGSLGYDVFHINYTFTALDVLGASHRLSLSFIWDLKKRAGEKAIDQFLDIEPEAEPTSVAVYPKRAPTPNTDIDLDRLIAEPLVRPTAVVTKARAPKKRGILSGLARLFGFGRRDQTEEEKAQKKEEAARPRKSLVKSFLSLFGIGEDEVAPEEDKRNKPEDMQLEENDGELENNEEEKNEFGKNQKKKKGFWGWLIGN